MENEKKLLESIELEQKSKKQIDDEKLRLMVFKSALLLGKKVDEHLLDMYGFDKNKYTFMLPIKENFFQDGHFKVELLDTVRSKDIFAITDIGNYSLEYNMHGFVNHTSPNDLLMELKDGIGACNSHADKINIIMPLLYAGRQHRRQTRENLLCGQMLHEFEMNRHLKSIITFDAHDQGVEHALHDTEFDNFLPSNVILSQLINDLSIEDLMEITVVAPDNGANGRRNVYLNSLNTYFNNIEAGSFYKQRNFNKLEDGMYPVTSHDYCGNINLYGKTAIVTDDMISSGTSMFDVINELKAKKVKKVYLVVTYALFTKGIDKFREYYKNGLLDGVYTTNLSYIPEDYLKEEWVHVCDCSKTIANIIFNIQNNKSISNILKDKSEPIKLLEKKYNDSKKI